MHTSQVRFLFVASLLVGTAAIAQSSSNVESAVISTTIIHTCADKFDGITRIALSKEDCHAFERAASWNFASVEVPQSLAMLQALPRSGGTSAPASLAVAALGQTITAPVGTIYSVCITKATGVPRFVLSAAKCTTSEDFAQWNYSGPVGPQGPVGPAGPTGPKGDTGTAGAPGSGATIPANLTLISQDLSTNGIAYLGAVRFKSVIECQLGDMLLSVNGYGSGAYLPADGRLLSITTNTALFSIMGTNFGGNGQTNFQLPDLRPFTPQGLQWNICASGVFPSTN